jgi:putative endonuclease
MSANLDKGNSAELLAFDFLRGKGYRIVARQYRQRYGEIDLVGWDGEILAFVEVKYRAHLEHGRPEESVNKRKQRQICRVSKEYRIRHKLHDINYRYDIVSIQGSLSAPRIKLIKNAFKE